MMFPFPFWGSKAMENRGSSQEIFSWRSGKVLGQAKQGSH